MRELVDTNRELEAAIMDYQQLGFEVTEREQGRAVLKRGLRGGWGWHILYFLLAPIYGNVVYSAYRRFDRPERVIVRVRGFAEKNTEGAMPDSDVEDREG